MKKKVAICCAGVIVCVTVAFFLFLPDPEPFPHPAGQQGPIYIAHAGGVIDGHPYTNSREAVNASVDAGFRFIELDLHVTADNDIAALHDIRRFIEMTGYQGPVEDLTTRSITSLSILDRYTPLISKDINEIFADKRLCLVTDKAVPPRLLREKITIDTDRLLVEVFSYVDYVAALRNGIRYPMLSLPEKRHVIRNMPFLLSGKIAIVTTKAELVREEAAMLRELRERGVTIFASPINDPDFAARHVGATLDGIYTDVLVPLGP